MSICQQSCSKPTRAHSAEAWEQHDLSLQAFPWAVEQTSSICINSMASVWGPPPGRVGAPPQALFLVPPTASSGTSAPSALPQVPWPEFLPLSSEGGLLP